MKREDLIVQAIRLSKQTPFSVRLNHFIYNWYQLHQNFFIFTETDDFDGDDIEGTFEKHKQRFQETGKIHIWTGASDNTIFGEPTINHMFRAWHDYIHITQNKGYDFLGESFVCEIQKSMLPSDWELEKELVQIEIVGQALYFMEHGEFLNDQRSFTINYLKSPIILKTKGL